VSGNVTFAIVLRGYERRGVDEIVDLVEVARRTNDPKLVEQAREALAAPQIVVRMRGYDRQQVHEYLTRARADLGSPTP
jgi:cell division septum initiation protein DivIVA